MLTKVTLASLKNEKLFRIDHNAPAEPRTEKEMRARAAELTVHMKGSKEDGITSEDFPTYLRTKLGWFDYKTSTGEPVNPKGLEWKYSVTAKGTTREGYIDEHDKI